MNNTPPRGVPNGPGPAVDPWATSRTSATPTTGLQPPPGPWAPSPRQNTTRTVLLGAIIGLSILIVAAVGIGAFMLLGDDDPAAQNNSPTSPQTFALTGTFVLTQGYDGSNANCSGRGGYRDISAGTQVTVTDAVGATIALGQLGTGQVRDGGCGFDFTIQDVPAGKDFYGIEVAHRGVVRFTADEAKSGSAKLTLG